MYTCGYACNSCNMAVRAAALELSGIHIRQKPEFPVLQILCNVPSQQKPDLFALKDAF